MNPGDQATFPLHQRPDAEDNSKDDSVDCEMQDSKWYEEEDYGNYDDGEEHNKTTRDLLDVIRHSIGPFSRNLIFACGGSVPITRQQDAQPELVLEQGQKPPTSSSSPLSTPSCNPVTLRWDSPDSAAPGSRCKLTFPVEPSTSDNLSQLVTAAAPATFGSGGKDVYDESYRKASKLEPSQFSINFSPYECGIIDAVAQILLPGCRAPKGHRAVRAELYKLNVYAGPSGHFRPDVDTTQSENQFGSLVVCLPVAHEGGRLEVRHKGETTAFDWSKPDKSQSTIQGAAFYSDCEHEGFEVRSGHRITLTYNLYAMRGNGQLTGHYPKALHMAQLPLYQRLQDMMSNKAFMPEGGFLGFYTKHSYPHTSGNFFAEDDLKGIDMAIWECFYKLKCTLQVLPVITNHPAEDWSGYESQMRYIGRSSDIEFHGDVRELAESLGEWAEESFSHSDVTWLNDPGHEEFQITYLDVIRV
ncbi:hypothetical protein GGR54DRAFT_196978 [Hypoxylon sp. NC1633]|nr:hypothetical protein GGR54DRAFT_196978 [Hypoxylon sp. NC1633]